MTDVNICITLNIEGDICNGKVEYEGLSNKKESVYVFLNEQLGG